MTDRLDPEAIERLTSVSEPWLSCDGCFAMIDTAIDALLGGDAHPVLPGPLRVHLLSCTVCHEEAECLAEMIAADHGLSESAAVQRLHDAI